MSKNVLKIIAFCLSPLLLTSCDLSNINPNNPNIPGPDIPDIVDPNPNTPDDKDPVDPNKPDDKDPVDPNKPDDKEPIDPKPEPIEPDPDIPTPDPDELPTIPENPEYFIQDPTEINILAPLNHGLMSDLMDLAKQFNAIEPNVTVNFKQVGSYADLNNQIIKGFATGDYCDMALIYNDYTAQMLDYGYNYDLTPFIQNEQYGFTQDEIADFYDPIYNDCQKFALNGIYSLPYKASTECMVYDAKILGLRFENVNNGNPITKEYMNSLTWEELFNNLCPALVNYSGTHKDFIYKTDNKWGILGYDNSANLFELFSKEYGFETLSFDDSKNVLIDFKNPRAKKCMLDLANYAKKHYIFTTGTYDMHTDYLFNSDLSLLNICSYSGLRYCIKNDTGKNVEIAMIPHKEGGQQMSILQGPSFSFFKQNNVGKREAFFKQLSSFLFYKFLIKNENYVYQVFNNLALPFKKSLLNYSEYKIILEEILSDTGNKFMYSIGKFLTMNDKIGPGLFSPIHTKISSEARSQEEIIVDKVMQLASVIDEKTIDRLFDEAYNNIMIKL